MLPLSIGLNIPVSKNLAQKLASTGIRVITQSVEQTESRSAARAAEAARAGAAVSERLSGAAHVVDTGVEIWQGGLEDATLAQFAEDVRVADGYFMKRLYVVERPDGRFQLKVWWDRDGATPFATVANEALALIAQSCLGASYGRIYGYRNPNGSVTVNPTARHDRPVSTLIRLNAESGVHAA